jgi:ABC-type Fe3+ transport system substrate-binding protein
MTAQTNRPLLAILAFAAAVAFAAGAQAQQKWEDVLAAAKKEGEVNVHGGPGRVFTEVHTEGFKKLYPEIKVNYTGLSGRDAIPKITREREAGVYNWDVYAGGTPSILQTLKPAGAFVPLREALILPEVLDDKAWFGGLDYGWMDQEKKFTLAYDLTVQPPMFVNRDVVKPGDFETFADLLKPQFADKIVWDDPRRPGQGVNTAQALLVNFGPEFLAKFFSGQKMVYTTNRRQNAEWVVRGRYPIGMGTGVVDLLLFQDQGLGKNVKTFNADLKQLPAGPGFGTVSMFDRAPHPNAAKVYINWLLSKAGQTDWGATKTNSRRRDVPHPDPELLPKPGAQYINSQAEAEIPAREKATEIAKQNISAKAEGGQ